RYDVRKADPARLRPIEQGRHDGAGLADKCDSAFVRRKVREAGVEIRSRHHDANAIRADDAQQMRLGRGKNSLLQRFALLTELAEPRGDDNGSPCSSGAE